MNEYEYMKIVYIYSFHAIRLLLIDRHRSRMKHVIGGRNAMFVNAQIRKIVKIVELNG